MFTVFRWAAGLPYTEKVSGTTWVYTHVVLVRFEDIECRNTGQKGLRGCRIQCFRKGCDRMGHKDDVRMDKRIDIVIWEKDTIKRR